MKVIKRTVFSLLLLLLGNFAALRGASFQPPPCLNISATTTPESCSGNGDGAISLAVSGGIGPYSFLWSTGDAVADLLGLSSGTYSVTVTDSVGCEVIDSFQVGSLGLAPLALAGPDTVLCEDVLQMSAAPPVSGMGIWQLVSGAATFADSSNPSTPATGFAPGSNLLAWVVSQGACADADTLEVYLSHAAKVDAGPDDSLCSPPYQLSGSMVGTGTGTWTGLPSGFFSNSSNPQSQVSGLATGPNLLVWTVSELGCSASDSLELHLLPSPSAGFSFLANDLEVDFNDQSQLANSLLWTFGDGGSSTQAAPSHAYGMPGSYQACQWVQGDCGTDSICQTVTVTCAPPLADFSYLVQGFDVEFEDQSDASTSIAAWHWDFGDGDTSNLPDPVHSYLFPGTFFVCLKVTEPCGQDEFCQQVELNLVGNGAALENKARVWPQPAQDRLKVKLPLSGGAEADVWIIDLQGRQLRHWKEETDGKPLEKEIDLVGLPAGTYLLTWKGIGPKQSLLFTKN